ncbi:MAG: outer membrane beta-barrel protein [Pseudomonadota bacterium]
MRVRSILLVSAAAVALSTPALAQNGTVGFYIEGQGGVNWIEDLDVDVSGAPFPFTGFNGTYDNAVDFDPGWAASVQVGYGFGNGLVLEAEATYRDNGSNDDNAGEGVGGFTPVPNVDVESWAFMGNVIYEFGPFGGALPYIGVGAGVALVDLDQPVFGSDDDTVFAAQGIVGVAYPFTDHLSAVIDYRYHRAFDVEYSPGAAGGATAEADVINHTVMAGLRYTFAAPPAPPPPPAEPPVVVPETAFIVFFDWDRADLTPEANLVLDDVVVVANEGGYASIRLDGYTDLSGSAQYNLGLSERRANSVADGLIARGIAPDEIVIRAFGEENPLVPTPDGVREPQNRRVEIFLT